MPPPPPPSKSYLWNIVDSSSEDEDDYDDIGSRPMNQMFSRNHNDLIDDVPTDTKPTVIEKISPTLSSFSAPLEQGPRIAGIPKEQETRIRESRLDEKPKLIRNDTPETSREDDDQDDDEEEDDADNAEQISTSDNTGAKKKRKKKKKKKKKKGLVSAKETEGTTVQSSTADSCEQQSITKKKKSVRFDEVTIHQFERCLGTTVVPLDGGWPLGIGMEMTSARATRVTVQDYEMHKQEWLMERWEKLRAQELEIFQAMAVGATMSDGKKEPKTPLETRQWDHKPSGQKNPLFGLLIERERMMLLLGEAGSVDDVMVDRLKCKHLRVLEKQKEMERHSNKKEKSTSSRHDKNHQHRQNSSNGRAQSGSGNSGKFSKVMGHEERYNAAFTEYEVHHVRNELETLRNLRTQEDARGCTCRKMNVYIPPPHAGKKAAHRRLNFKVLIQELQKRSALPDDYEKRWTREDLEWLLHDVVQQEPCCREDSDCPCVLNGIDCQADACSCWQASHQFKPSQSPRPKNGKSKAAATPQARPANGDEIADHNDDDEKKDDESNALVAQSKTVTPAIIRGRCGNVIGMYTVDASHIDQYRQKQLSLYCQPICQEQQEQ